MTSAAAAAPARRTARLRVDWAAWRPAVLVAAGMYVVFRVVVELVALTAAYGVQFPNVVRRNPSALLLPWDRMDTNWFEYLAQHGFAHGPTTGYRPEVFGPVLPALMRGVSSLLHVSLLTAGLLVTNLCMVLALAALYRLVAEHFDRGVAFTTLFLLLAWPAAFFLGAAYSESIVLLMFAGAFLAAHRGWWLVAGVCAAVALLTKFYVMVVVVALVVERLQQRGPRRLLVRDLVMLLLPPLLALGGWMLYMQHLFGDPLAFEHAQSSFGRYLTWPWVLVDRTLTDLVHLRFLDTSYASAVEPFDVLAVLFTAGFAVYWWLRGRRSWAVLLGLSFLIFICEPFLNSEVRELDLMFPVFVGLAVMARRRAWLERLWTVSCLPVAVFLVSRFVENKFAG